MTLVMYDSITAADIPSEAEAVAGYADGIYRWSDADWARFPNALKVRIATRALTLDADALDIEPGNATPAQARGWVQNCRPAPGRLPLLYVNRGNRAAVEAAVQGLSYQLWVATLDGIRIMQPGAVATQYAGQNSGSGGHFDLSLVDEAYFGDAMTDDQIRERIYDWYYTIAGRFPNQADGTEIENHWLPAFKANPLQARIDFGVAAQAELPGKDISLVRHFELPQG